MASPIRAVLTKRQTGNILQVQYRPVRLSVCRRLKQLEFHLHRSAGYHPLIDLTSDCIAFF